MSTIETVLACLHDSLAHRGGRQPDLTAETQFEDIGLDDLERTDLAIAVEEEFGIEISDAEMGMWHSVRDVVSSVVAHQGAAA